MSLEIHGVRHLFTVTEYLPPSSSSSPLPRLLGWGEEHWTEAHSEVLVGHPVEGTEGGHQTEVVQKESQGGLERG